MPVTQSWGAEVTKRKGAREVNLHSAAAVWTLTERCDPSATWWRGRSPRVRSLGVVTGVAARFSAEAL